MIRISVLYIVLQLAGIMSYAQLRVQNLLCENRTNPVELEAALRGLLTNAEEFRTGNYQRKIDVNTQRTFELLAYLLETLTPNQRNHLSNRLESLAADLDQLSCDPASKKNRAE